MNKIFPLVLCGVIPAYGAFALSCANDYSGANGCASNATAAGDCETLGYATGDVEGCEHYLFCPFNPDYKRCVTHSCEKMGFTTDDKSSWCGKIISCESDNAYTACVGEKLLCPVGYDPRLTQVADCGSQGSNGWTFSSTTIPGNDGSSIICGKCTPKTCSGYSASYTSVNSCGAQPTGWVYSSCYSGDTLMGKCTAKSCDDYGYSPSKPDISLCKVSSSVYLGDKSSTCYDCVSCVRAINMSYRYVGDDNTSCSDVCAGHPNSRAYYRKSVADATDKYGRTGKCNVWKKDTTSNPSLAEGCCCGDGGEVGISRCQS